jgi:citrate synthase
MERRMSDEWIEAGEAARRLGIKRATLYAYVSRGLLDRRVHTDGRRSLFDAAQVARLRDRNAPPRDGHRLSFVSSVTVLGPDRPYYRGRDALDLARDGLGYERVAEWLWTGEDHPAADWRPRPDAVASAAAAQQVVPAHALPLDRVQLAVATLAVADPMRSALDPEAVRATARALVAGAVDALPTRGGGTAPSAGTIAERLWPKLTARPPRPELVRLLDAALVLLADHELAASTVAARIAASVRADPYAVVGAGLGVVGGPLHGGASLGAERLLAAIPAPDRASRAIGERVRAGERIPGFGHVVYENGDARATTLLQLIRETAGGHPRLAVAEAVVDELAGRGLPAMNVDFAVATLTGLCDMTVGAAEAVFAVARSAGWIAHALEEYERRTPLRPRAVYAGPPLAVPLP